MNPEEKLVFDFITDNNLFFDLIPHGANAQCNFCGKMESCGWRECGVFACVDCGSSVGLFPDDILYDGGF